MCLLSTSSIRYSSGQPLLRVCDEPLAPPDLRTSPSVDRDLDAILADGVLRVGLSPDPTSWFLDDRRFRGFEYEVVRGFARSLGVQLRVVPIAAAGERRAAVVDGEVDLAAGRLATLAADALRVVPLDPTPPAVLQTIDALCAGDGIDRLEDLRGREVVAIAGSGVVEALAAAGIDARITLLPDDTPLEDAIDGMRDHGRIFVGHLGPVRARVEGDPSLVVGPTVPAAGTGVSLRASGAALHAAFAAWVEENHAAIEMARVRHHTGPRPRRTKRVSLFDDLFRHHARRIRWRWPLLASVAWQESRFDPTALSVAGARGMMQIMPATGGDLGLRDPHDPAQSVAAGATYLRQLERRWQLRVPDAVERVKFVLASYNAGMGHVEDAVALAQASGLAGDRWSEVAPWMLALSEQEWNTHPDVVYGYCRGSEPVDYVRSIVNRWAAYEALLDPEADLPEPLL